MTERSLKRWVALRALHERWGVPLDMIQRATEFSDGALAKRAHSEEWNRNQSTPGIHARLINVFEDQLARLTKGESEGDEEKQAKALSLMAKTLESIALVGSKLAQVSQEHSDPNKGALMIPLPNTEPAKTENPFQQQIEHRNLITLLQNWLVALFRAGVLNDVLPLLPIWAKQQLADRWPVWARLHQMPELVPWTNWMLLGGRGAGKTRTGAEWLKAMALGDPCYTSTAVGHMALVGETYAAAREVMVEGHSGLLTIHQKEDRPVWTSSRRRLEWPNGAIAQVFSSEDPDALRGPQFAAAWCDAKTIWGSLVAVAAAILSMLGVEVDDASQAALVDIILQISTVAGSLFAILGRLNANATIE